MASPLFGGKPGSTLPPPESAVADEKKKREREEEGSKSSKGPAPKRLTSSDDGEDDDGESEGYYSYYKLPKEAKTSQGPAPLDIILEGLMTRGLFNRDGAKDSLRKRLSMRKDYVEVYYQEYKWRSLKGKEPSNEMRVWEEDPDNPIMLLPNLNNKRDCFRSRSMIMHHLEDASLRDPEVCQILQDERLDKAKCLLSKRVPIALLRVSGGERNQYTLIPYQSRSSDRIVHYGNAEVKESFSFDVALHEYDRLPRDVYPIYDLFLSGLDLRGKTWDDMTRLYDTVLKDLFTAAMGSNTMNHTMSRFVAFFPRALWPFLFYIYTPYRFVDYELYDKFMRGWAVPYVYGEYSGAQIVNEQLVNPYLSQLVEALPVVTRCIHHPKGGTSVNGGYIINTGGEYWASINIDQQQLYYRLSLSGKTPAGLAVAIRYGLDEPPATYADMTIRHDPTTYVASFIVHLSFFVRHDYPSLEEAIRSLVGPALSDSPRPQSNYPTPTAPPDLILDMMPAYEDRPASAPSDEEEEESTHGGGKETTPPSSPYILKMGDDGWQDAFTFSLRTMQNDVLDIDDGGPVSNNQLSIDHSSTEDQGQLETEHGAEASTPEIMEGIKRHDILTTYQGRLRLSHKWGFCLASSDGISGLQLDYKSRFCPAGMIPLTPIATCAVGYAANLRIPIPTTVPSLLEEGAFSVYIKTPRQQDQWTPISTEMITRVFLYSDQTFVDVALLGLPGEAQVVVCGWRDRLVGGEPGQARAPSDHGGDQADSAASHHGSLVSSSIINGLGLPPGQNGGSTSGGGGDAGGSGAGHTAPKPQPSAPTPSPGIYVRFLVFGPKLWDTGENGAVHIYAINNPFQNPAIEQQVRQEELQDGHIEYGPPFYLLVPAQDSITLEIKHGLDCPFAPYDPDDSHLEFLPLPVPGTDKRTWKLVAQKVIPNSSPQLNLYSSVGTSSKKHWKLGHKDLRVQHGYRLGSIPDDLQQLSSGHFADTFIVKFNHAPGRTFVMKKYKDFAGEGYYSFIREIFLGSQFHLRYMHHLPRLYDICEYGGGPVIMMEHLQGASLYNHQLFQHPSPQPFVSDLSALSQLVCGLSKLHEERLLHCDIKLDNLILQPPVHGGSGGARLSICDLGLAVQVKDLDDRVPNSQRVYELDDYATAPEEVDSGSYEGHYSAKSDVWRLGCVALQLLSRRQVEVKPDETSPHLSIIPHDINIAHGIVGSTFGIPQMFNKIQCPHARVIVRNMLELDPNIRPSAGEIMQKLMTTGHVCDCKSSWV